LRELRFAGAFLIANVHKMAKRASSEELKQAFEEHLELHRLDCLSSHRNLEAYEFVRRFLADVQAAADSIATLNPRPGLEVSSEDPKYVVPDLLVERVDDYPEFLPWCPASRARPLSDGSVEATIEIAFHGVRSRFTTRNVHLVPSEIRMTLVDGPFRSLSGRWHFLELPEQSCKVSLHLQYQFAVGPLGRLIAPVFESIAGSLIDAFARRAESLYA